MKKGLFAIVALSLLTADAQAGCRASRPGLIARLFPRLAARHQGPVASAPAAASCTPAPAATPVSTQSAPSNCVNGVCPLPRR